MEATHAKATAKNFVPSGTSKLSRTTWSRSTAKHRWILKKTFRQFRVTASIPTSLTLKKKKHRIQAVAHFVARLPFQANRTSLLLTLSVRLRLVKLPRFCTVDVHQWKAPITIASGIMRTTLTVRPRTCTHGHLVRPMILKSKTRKARSLI